MRWVDGGWRDGWMKDDNKADAEGKVWFQVML